MLARRILDNDVTSLFTEPVGEQRGEAVGIYRPCFDETVRR